jgi:hypothetical protein
MQGRSLRGGVATIVVAVAAALTASTVPAHIGRAQPVGTTVTLAQVRQIALREAARDRDPRPTRILVASGTLRAASRVISPDSVLYPHPTPAEEVELNSPYYLVLMRGHFKPIYSHPPHAHGIGPVTVIELLIGARPGGISGRSLGTKVPVPLSRLGKVTRLL